MNQFTPMYIYLGLVLVVTALLVACTALFPSNKKSSTKFLSYESGIQTETELLQHRFPLRHYLVALLFLIFDIEVLFLYPWAIVGKELGIFAWYEMAIFFVILSTGFIYAWNKGGLEWE